MNMRNKLVFLLLILLEIISSCGVRSAKKAAETPRGESAEESMEESDFLPVRSFLHKGEEVKEGFGAYGYLLFTSKPDSIERMRYLRVCQAFHHKIQPLEDFADNPRELLMVTFWFLSFASPEDAMSDDCKVLVDSYDYSRAQQFVAAIGKLDAKGPILAAWHHPPHAEIANNEVLIFDLSNFAEEDYERAFRIWKDRISKNPEAWQDGFNLVIIREELRNFLQKYGETIVTRLG